jgi:hypothetical protein
MFSTGLGSFDLRDRRVEDALGSLGRTVEIAMEAARLRNGRNVPGARVGKSSRQIKTPPRNSRAFEGLCPLPRIANYFFFFAGAFLVAFFAAAFAGAFLVAFFID